MRRSVSNSVSVNLGSVSSSEEKLDTKICPVCGKKGFLTWRWAKQRQYVYPYFGHTSEDGKRIWCYISKDLFEDLKRHLLKDWGVVVAQTLDLEECNRKKRDLKENAKAQRKAFVQGNLSQPDSLRLLHMKELKQTPAPTGRKQVKKSCQNR